MVPSAIDGGYAGLDQLRPRSCLARHKRPANRIHRIGHEPDFRIASPQRSFQRFPFPAYIFEDAPGHGYFRNRKAAPSFACMRSMSSPARYARSRPP